MASKKLTHWLKVTPLEDRLTPSASLVDVNNQFLGSGDRPANILGMSDNGRYVIFESTATDLIIGQQDLPDTNDLFWKDLQTGDTRMVTALPAVPPNSATYDYSATRTAPESFAFQAIQDGQQTVSFVQAVISSDGTAVAFSSPINAARLDDSVANFKYNPNLTTKLTITDLDNSNDVFRWNSADGQINLASRTLPQPGGLNNTANSITYAFGRYGGANNPATSRDGSYVGFTSQVDAGYTNDTKGQGSLTSYNVTDGKNTNDVFVTLFERDVKNQVTFLKASVISAIGVVFNAPAPFSPSDIGSEAQTFGIIGGGTGVSVDANGRYLAEDTNGNVNVVFTAPVNSTFSGPTTLLRREAFRVELQPSLEAFLTPHLVSVSAVAGGGGGGGGGATFTGITPSGGSASNVIIGPTNAYRTMVSANVPAATGLFAASTSGGTGLYFVNSDQALPVPTVTRLTNSQPIVNGSLDLDSFQMSPNGRHAVWTALDAFTNKNQVSYQEFNGTTIGTVTKVSVGVDGNFISGGASFPRVSRNGRYVSFATDTPANLVSRSTDIDTNGVSDVFIRDMISTTNAGGGVVPPNTRLLSIASTTDGTTRSGNKASTRGFIGTNLEAPVNGVTPNQHLDGAGRAVFNSRATNIDTGFVINHANLQPSDTSVFTIDLPIDGIPPDRPPTDAPRTGIVSGGRDAGIAAITFSGSGTVTLGSRLTPYPNFTGEIRVASADFNGDGVVDYAVAPGKGLAPRVVVFNGANNKRLYDFFGYETTFTGGVNIAAADINGDGKAEIVLGADAGGGARVRVLDLFNSTTLVDFFAYNPEFRGGVRVATGDFNGDGTIDVLTGAGIGGGPRVSAFNGVNILGGTLNRFIDFFAMELNLRNGVFVAGGDFNNDGVDDIVVGAGEGGAPRVRVFESASVVTRPNTPDLLYDFFAGNTNSRSGIRVAVKNVDGDNIADIVTGEGFKRESRIRTFSGAKFSAPLTPTELTNTFVVFDDLTSLNGAWVG